MSLLCGGLVMAGGSGVCVCVKVKKKKKHESIKELSIEVTMTLYHNSSNLF